ncbi:MAG: adenylate/guanylate cyclase domain-containing protein [Burkholderiales bacterium]
MTPASESFVQRLRHAGIEPNDSDDLKIRKTILVFAMGLMTAAPMFWLAVYWLMGIQLSATLPLGFQFVSVATLLIYVATRSFSFFCYAQLSLFLFFPFVAQLSIGNFISASGVVLWGILAPICAVPVLGARASIPWFIGHIAIIIMCGVVDYQLASTLQTAPHVPLRTSAVFFSLNFIAISSMAFFVLRFAAVQKERYEDQLSETHRLLQVEQDRSEKLLLNILPTPIAERLKQENQTIADGFADVTVMFADIVNFTSIAAGMAPSGIFAMLNSIFSAFDQLAETHRLEKIKTIGDAYMVAGGLDDEDVDYTRAIANMALDMRALLETDPELRKMGLAIRMGIGTGPVVAGVVGKKKFIYDLWGDTVNLASRITTEGTPGMVHVDATTYLRLRAHFDFDAPRSMHLKGKGETTVYRLIDRKPA